MKKYAQINGNTVINVIVADSKEDAEAALDCTLVEITEANLAGIGSFYDELTGLFSDQSSISVRESIAGEAQEEEAPAE